MSEQEKDSTTAAAVAYVDAYWWWRNAEARMDEARERHRRAVDECDQARTKAMSAKALLLETIRNQQ